MAKLRQHRLPVLLLATIGVLGVLKKAGAPAAVESKIMGEALFNDGTAVVAFLTLVGLAAGTSEFSGAAISTALAREVIGGILAGRAGGYGASFIPVQLLAPARRAAESGAVRPHRGKAASHIQAVHE